MQFLDRFYDWMVLWRWRWTEASWWDVVRTLAIWGVSALLVGLFGWWWFNRLHPSEDSVVLTSELRSDSWPVRRRAYQLLHERDDSARSFAYALRDQRTEIRLEAAQALAQYRFSTADAVPALLEAMQDDDPEIRCLAAQALAHSGSRSPEAIPALKQALLHDKEEAVRLYAAEALRFLEDE